MPVPESKSLQPLGNLALARAVGLKQPAQVLRRLTYVGGSRERELIREEDGVQRTERHLPAVYAPPAGDGLLGQIAFALKHEVPHFGLLEAVFRQVPPAEVATYVAASPTGAYARRIGFLYEFLTGNDLTPLLKDVKIGGNYADLVDPAKLVTGEPLRDARWLVFNNLPGSRAYLPMIERTTAVEQMLKHDWHHEATAALAVQSGNEGLLKRALNYLYRKETRSSFEIERETPSETRTARFVEVLKQAGHGSSSDALSEESLTGLQNLIVDTRYAERGYRSNQNYVGSVVRWQTVVDYIPPPPEHLPGLMQGLAQSVSRLGAEPLAQAAVASFGLVFHHPFNDGNGRLHRYLLHDFMARSRLMPSGLALPVSAAILEDMPGYDRALEPFSKTVSVLVDYKLNGLGELAVLNAEDAGWVWRYPDLTPQVEYLGRKLKAAVVMVAEEVSYLAKYDALAARAKEVVDLPDRRLADLLVLIHQSDGHLSNNKRKQRFEELTNKEIAAIESAYAEVFQLPDQSVVPVGGITQSPGPAVGGAQEPQEAIPVPSPRKEPGGH